MAQIVLQPKNAGNNYAVNVIVNYTETNVNNNANTSDVYFEVILSRNSWSTSWTGYGQQIYVDVVINGVLNRVYIPRYNYKGHNLPNSIFGSGTVTGIVHNDNGSKTINISASIVDNAGETYTSGSASASSTMALTNIPRYANITSFVVNQRDETSLSVSWSADAPCDWSWYRIRQSGGSFGNWIDCGSNFNITGLSANTTYIVQVKVRRTDSQMVKESGDYRQTTLAYPHSSTTPNFTIGNTCTLGIYNPLGRSCKIYIKNPLNTEKEIGTITGQTTTIPNTSEWTTFLYNGIPNSQSGMYRVRVVCSAVSQDITLDGGTYNIDTSINKPNVSNYSASYVANLTNLTNNNQTVINNVSTITYTINTGATAQNGASISEYTVTWGSATPQKITNIANPATLVRGNGNTISVTVKDSRGITNTVSTSISEVIDYTSPTQLIASLNRLDGVGEDVYLDISGIIYYDKFGTNGVANKITDVKYSISNETAQNVSISLSSLAYSEQSSTNHTQRFSITNAPISIDGLGGGFDTTKTYRASIVVTDTSGTTSSITGTIKDGKFALDGIQNNDGDYCYGINGLANEDYALTVHNKILSESTLDIGTQLNSDFRTNIISSRNLFDKQYGDEIINSDCIVTEYGNGFKIQANATTGRQYIGFKITNDILGKQITIRSVATGTKTQYVRICYINGSTITEYLSGDIYNPNFDAVMTIPSTLPSGTSALLYISTPSTIILGFAIYGSYGTELSP